MKYFILVTYSSHSITQDVNLIETAKAATFFLSDGIIITGSSTGQPAEPKDVKGILHLTILIFYMVNSHYKLSYTKHHF